MATTTNQLSDLELLALAMAATREHTRMTEANAAADAAARMAGLDGATMRYNQADLDTLNQAALTALSMRSN